MTSWHAPSRRERIDRFRRGSGHLSSRVGTWRLPRRRRPAAPKHKGVIDLHHHFWAPEYLKAQDDWEDSRHLPHIPQMQNWSPQMSLATMDGQGGSPDIGRIARLDQPRASGSSKGQAADKVDTPRSITAPKMVTTTRAASASSRRSTCSMSTCR